VPSSRLSALLALQRVEEPDTATRFFEVTGDELVVGLREGRYDAGVLLQDVVSIPSLSSQPLWRENMAVAVPPQFHLPNQAKLTIAELRNYPVFRWQAEACHLLDQRLSSLVTGDQQRIQHVTSFELLALWVAAGHGVGVSAQSRIERAAGWGITMRPLSDRPYEVVTYLQRRHQPANSVVERFECRALQVAGADTV
jgi:DNA-binding transcriptional LysR family regulator